MSLLMTVERHLRRSAIAPSRFGRDVARDPRFVFDLRKGREPRQSTSEKVLAFIAHRNAIALHVTGVTQAANAGKAMTAGHDSTASISVR